MERAKFSSKYASTLTCIGVAVGLGNVWRFPYMMGEYGGSAFLIIYLLFTVFLAIPGLTAEWTLGRATGKGPIVA
jgi:NSS family neurotransmitter:Na+ symporter